jgi:hypothetical protein
MNATRPAEAAPPILSASRREIFGCDIEASSRLRFTKRFPALAILERMFWIVKG